MAVSSVSVDGSLSALATVVDGETRLEEEEGAPGGGRELDNTCKCVGEGGGQYLSKQKLATTRLSSTVTVVNDILFHKI